MRPRELSFKGAWQTLSAHRPRVEQAAFSSLAAYYDGPLEAIAYHRIGDRPDRYEPRAIKRRPKSQKLLTIPRHKARESAIRS